MGNTRSMSTLLYVGNLSWDTTSDSLSAMLSEYGTVNSCDTGTVRNGRTRGWAIVSMGTESECAFVIQTCHDMEFEGRQLTVRLDSKPDKPVRAPREGGGKGKGGGGKGAARAEGADGRSGDSGLQVVVRNLPWSVTSEMLQGTFEQIGEVTEAVVVCHADSGRSKGWGTVRFTSPSDAADAIARFGGVELAGRPMTIMMDRFE